MSNKKLKAYVVIASASPIDREEWHEGDKCYHHYHHFCDRASEDDIADDIEEMKEKYGKASSHKDIKTIAHEWAKKLKNVDGTTGPHWTQEETKMVAESHHMTKYDPDAWYITMNMMYSDYAMICEKFGIDCVAFSCAMADAFLKDEDAVPATEKIKEYYEHIVRH